jgi:hypothetical protein
MPLEQYIEKRFNSSSQKLIAQANVICDEYMGKGFTLTLRQLYYQFVARGLLPNKQPEYKRLGSVINDARLAGLIDWDAIEDRTRHLTSNSHWASQGDILQTAVDLFAIDKWSQQGTRVEVWIEKEALIGVVEPACSDLDVPYFACRGYSSQSEQWRASHRFRRFNNANQQVVILHFGDHDPSGVDMTRDNQDRLDIFLGNFVTVRRMALNWEQIEEHSPPPNPVKLTDSRSDGYREKFGDESWELDALNPEIIDALIRDAVLGYRDEDEWDRAIAAEEVMRQRLREYRMCEQYDG